MKAIIALLLTLATMSTAAPSPDKKPALLSTRQECVYSCGCQVDNDGEGTDPDTAPCCASVGGLLGNEDTVRDLVLGFIPAQRRRERDRAKTGGKQLCTSMTLTTAQAYARCCGSSGGYFCFQSGKSCPPVTIN